MWSHTKRHFHPHSDGLGEVERELPAETSVLFNMDVLPGRQEAPGWDFKLSEAHGGGDRSGSSPAGEDPGVGASACFPHSWDATGDAFQDDAFQDDAFHDHKLQGHLPTHCPPRKELCDPWKFLGEQTLTHLLLSHCLPDPCVPPSTEQPQPLAETWIVFAFPFWGFASCPGHVTIPEKARFSVLSCSFVLA